MNIKGLVVWAVIGVASAASANLLLWQVGDAGVAKDAEGSEIEYSYAKIMGAPDNSYTGNSLSVMGGDFEGTTNKGIGGDVFSKAAVAAILGDDAVAPYFYIELFDAANNSVGQSSIASYAELGEFIKKTEFDSSWMNAQKWSGGTYHATPEPTSGLLMLLGAAMLGLRRRKVA